MYLNNNLGDYDSRDNKLTREKFKELIYYPKQDGKLDIKVLSEETFDKYTRKLVEYTGYEDERIQAYLLVPKDIKDKSPGVVAIHANSLDDDYKNGKSVAAGVINNEEFNYGLELCLNGYVVICPDRFPYESRNLENLKVGAHSGTSLEEIHRIYMCNKLLYEGCTEISRELFELGKAVDVLQNLEEVNENRIGVIGASEGGLLSMLFMFIDERVKVGCANYNMYFPDNVYGDNKVKTLRAFDMYMSIPGLKNYGEIYEILSGIAPRPFIFTQREGSTEGEYYKKFYNKIMESYLYMRVPHKFSSIVFNSKSNFPQDVKNKCYYWIKRWI